MDDAITIYSDHEVGAYDSLSHVFLVTLDDSDDGWRVYLDIPEWGLGDSEFEVKVFWADPDTGEEFEADPVNIHIRDEIERLTQDAHDDAAAALIPHDPWADAGVRQSDFL